MKVQIRSAASCSSCLILVISAASYLASSETSSPRPNTETTAVLDTESKEIEIAGALPIGIDLEQPEAIASYCEGLSRGKAEAPALQAACEFSLSLRSKLPDVICDQATRRYQEDLLGNVIQQDLITAKVRYSGGQEQYSQIALDGKPVESRILQSSGTWSEGEFATGLRTIFLPQSSAEFKFSKQERLRSREVLVFEFKVDRRNNRSWYIKASGPSTFPGYRGRIWIDKTTSQLVRFERKMTEVENDFPIQQVSTTIDYADVDLADGTKFVLPVQAANLTCPTVASSDCWHSQLTFRHWQKFAVRARILTSDDAGAPRDAPPGSRPEVVSIPQSMELFQQRDISGEMQARELAEIYARHRQAEVIASFRIGEDKGLPRLVPPSSQGDTRAKAAGGRTESPISETPTFKASARLVQVPAVVRDSQGHAVDYLKKPDFRLFDDRKQQVITSFSLERPGKHLILPEDSAEPSKPIVEAEPTRFAAYVFDDIHVAMDDLSRARDAAKRHITSLRSGDRVAVFTLSGTVGMDFTNDRSRLNGALSQIRPHPLTAAGSVRCPDISYAQADLIQKNDAIALEQARDEAMRCAFAGDSTARIPAERLARDTAAQVLISGRAESQRSFHTLNDVVRYLARMPGQRIIVLVSPGFPIAEMQQESTGIIDEAQNAQIIINVLDPSGLPTRSTIEMGSLSTPTDVLIDLSGGTGGSFYRNRNDVDEGFFKTALPELFYVLGFSPQKLDGKFHSLKVIVERTDKLSVQARRGYYALRAEN